MPTNVKRPRSNARKTKHRSKIINQVIGSVKHPDVLDAIDRESWGEDRICTFMYKPLVQGMEDVFHDLKPNQQDSTWARNANRAVLWSPHKETTINNVQFLGMSHRTDFVINVEDISIAIEVKLGKSGAAIREGIGQSLVYSTHYDFTIFLVVDASGDMSVMGALKDSREAWIAQTLWKRFNIKIEVV